MRSTLFHPRQGFERLRCTLIPRAEALIMNGEPMKKKSPALPREQFNTRFLNKLQSFASTDPTIKLILKTQVRREQCAALLWNCETAAPRLAEISDRRHAFWAAEYETAIRGADAFVLIARESGSSEFAEVMLRAKQLVLGLQRGLPTAFPPAQARGRAGRDWGAVLYAQRMLEGYLGGEQISDATLATLLDVAAEVLGRKPASKNAVRLGLAHLRERLPQTESTLSKFYPRGEKLPEPPVRSQLAQK
jgi:hypothetical protein